MQIDLNADIGEGFADEAIVPWLSSANISCGAHAGSLSDIRRALQLCKNAEVAVGAHPSYPDRTNFGRRVMEIPLHALKINLMEQLDSFLALAAAERVSVSHIKAHGALYNIAAQDRQLGRLLLELSSHYQLPLMTLAHSPLQTQAQWLQVPVIAEAFADRGYQANGQLLPRTAAGALLNTKDAINQSLRLITQQQITTASGEHLSLQADSLCLHGDSQEAVTLARELHQALLRQQIQIKAKTFANPVFQIIPSEVSWTQ